MRVINIIFMLVVALSFGNGLSGASEPLMEVELSEASNPLVDWSEWPDPSHELDSTNTWSEFFMGRTVSARPEESTGYEGSLRQLVDECARRLELRSVSCDGDARDAEYRLPFMESGDLPCGFQVHQILALKQA